MTSVPVTSGLHFLFHSGSITPVSNGTTVSSVADLSGLGNTASVQNGTYRTGIFPNGLPAVRTVDGTIYGNLSSFGTAGTFMIMAVTNVTLGSYRGFGNVHNASTNDYQQAASLFISCAGNPDYSEIFSCGNSTIGPVYTQTAVFGIGMSSTELVIVDGAGVVRRKPIAMTPQAQTRYQFGSRWEGALTNKLPTADWGICGVWNRLPSDSEIQSICNWASRETGLITAVEVVSAF